MFPEEACHLPFLCYIGLLLNPTLESILAKDQHQTAWLQHYYDGTFCSRDKNLERTIKIKDAAKILHHAPQLCQQIFHTMDTLFKRTIPHVLPCGQNLDL